MFNIKIDEALMVTLAARNVRLEELFVIACLNLDQLVQLRAYLKVRNHDQLSAYMQPLERKLLIRQLVKTDDFSWDNYELTDLADRVFEECSQHIVDGTQPVTQVPTADLIELVESFLLLYPEGVRNKNGDYLRSHQKDIVTKMNTFVNKYKYPTDVILGATARYLTQQSQEQYAWTNAAHFFISKNGVSKLAAECESYKRDPKDVSTKWRENLM